MPHDYEDIDDRAALTDAELRGRIIEQFKEYPELDGDLVDVDVSDGRVTLSGRVGTEREYQEFEHVTTDVLGLTNVTNEIVIDELVRAEYPEAADEAAVQRIREEGTTSGAEDRTSDEAAHLLEDTTGEQFGTNDLHEAIERGFAYDPPSTPIQEGTESREQH
ncbi:MAG: BON domain-containing protein [Longimicrobiales bacterium]